MHQKNRILVSYYGSPACSIYYGANLGAILPVALSFMKKPSSALFPFEKITLGD
jgi:hypothetical protein